MLRAFEAYCLEFRGGRKRTGELYLDCAHSLEQAFKRGIASEQDESRDGLEKLMIMVQYIYVVDKELVPRLRDKKFWILKEAATWAEDYVLAYGQEPQTGSLYRRDGGPRGPGSTPPGFSGTPRHNVSFGSKTGNGTPQVPTPTSAKDGAVGKSGSQQAKV